MDTYEAFATVELATLEQWVKEGRQEDLHLDFKTVQSSPNLTKDDRKNLAKGISGFANSDGGIICWGIDCRSVDGVDSASALAPLAQAAAVLSTLNGITGEASVPRVERVDHRLIPSAGDEGFILSYIPASESGPHMATQGEGRYYKRSGSSFYRMEHFDIADMFGKRGRPRLEPPPI